MESNSEGSEKSSLADSGSPQHLNYHDVIVRACVFHKAPTTSIGDMYTSPKPMLTIIATKQMTPNIVLCPCMGQCSRWKRAEAPSKTL